MFWMPAFAGMTNFFVNEKHFMAFFTLCQDRIAKE
jgi:hypothetical protein